MPVMTAPQALLRLWLADHPPATRTAVNEHLRPVIGQHPSANASAERLNAIGQRRCGLRVAGDPVAAQDEFCYLRMPEGSLPLGQMRPADALLELGHQPRVVIPYVASQFPRVVVLHSKISAADLETVVTSFPA